MDSFGNYFFQKFAKKCSDDVVWFCSLWSKKHRLLNSMIDANQICSQFAMIIKEVVVYKFWLNERRPTTRYLLYPSPDQPSEKLCWMLWSMILRICRLIHMQITWFNIFWNISPMRRYYRLSSTWRPLFLFSLLKNMVAMYYKYEPSRTF